MKEMQTKVLVEAGILTAVAAILMIMSYYIPFFTFIGVILWPIPITLLTFKYNIKVSLVSLAALLIIVSSMIAPLTAMGLVLLYGVTAVVLGFCLRRRYTPFATIVAAALSMFISYIITIKLSGLLLGVDIMNVFYQSIEESIARSKEIMKGIGFTDQQINDSMLKGIDPEHIKMVLPGMLAVMSIFGAYINYYIVDKTFRKLGLKINELKPMDQWYIGSSISYGLFFSTMVAWLLASLKVSNADIVFNSLFIIFNFVFQINGLAVVYWFLKSRRVPKAATIFIIIILFLTGVALLLFYLGLIDYVIDFRKINPSRRRRIPPGE